MLVHANGQKFDHKATGAEIREIKNWFTEPRSIKDTVRSDRIMLLYISSERKGRERENRLLNNRLLSLDFYAAL